jgi:hypothetical protein
MRSIVSTRAARILHDGQILRVAGALAHYWGLRDGRAGENRHQAIKAATMSRT